MEPGPCSGVLWLQHVPLKVCAGNFVPRAAILEGGAWGVRVTRSSPSRRGHDNHKKSGDCRFKPLPFCLCLPPGVAPARSPKLWCSWTPQPPEQREAKSSVLYKGPRVRFCVSSTDAKIHTHTRAHMHKHTHTHTNTQRFSLWWFLLFGNLISADY